MKIAVADHMQANSIKASIICYMPSVKNPVTYFETCQQRGEVLWLSMSHLETQNRRR